MKFLLISIIFLTFSTTSFACPQHHIKLQIDQKLILKSGEFKIESVTKKDDKWIMVLKFSKKLSKKFSDLTAKNIGKKVEMLFDQDIINTSVIAERIILPSDTFTVSTNFDDAQSAALQVECQHSN